MLRGFAAVITLALAAGALGGCAAPATKAVALASHDSFIIPDELINKFKTDTGFYLEGGAKLGDKYPDVRLDSKDVPLGATDFGNIIGIPVKPASGELGTIIKDTIPAAPELPVISNPPPIKLPDTLPETMVK